MNKICAHVCSWKGPEILKEFIPRFLDSITEDVVLLIALNEVDQESIDICHQYNIGIVPLNTNFGTLAVDFLIPYTNAEYVLQTNTDMYFPKGWDTAMIRAIENNGNCSVSLFLVEPIGTNSPLVIVDNLGEFSHPDTCARFRDNFSQGKYKIGHKISYNHPILTKFSDLKSVGGYSNCFDMRYFPGYSLDDFFAFRLKWKYGGDFTMFTLGDWCVYHGISQTTNKLPREIKDRSGLDAFQADTGMNWDQFRSSINCFAPLSIK